MNEFENKLIIKEENYQNGFFPKIPNFKKRGSAFILTAGCNDDIIVDEYTTVKQIRQGKYTQMVEISTLPYTKEIRFSSPGREKAYFFNVYIKAVIQVKDPILFYENKNLDVDAYFENLLLLDVKKITQKYSILDYEGMDGELNQKLSSYNTIDEATGFSYRISVVDASPGEEAKEYVYRYSKQQLDIELKNNARRLTAYITDDFEEAIRTEIAEGKKTEVEGILEIQEHKNAALENFIKRVEELREKGFLTDKDARLYITDMWGKINPQMSMQQIEKDSEQNKMKISEIGKFYVEEEKE